MSGGYSGLIAGEQPAYSDRIAGGSHEPDGENTRAWYLDNQRRATTPEQPRPSAPVKDRRFRLPRLRRKAPALLPAPVAPVAEQPAVQASQTAHAIDVAARFAANFAAQLTPAGNTADEPTWGYVAREHLVRGTEREPTAAELAEHEAAADDPDVGDALEWGPWDNPENRQPMRPLPPWQPVPANVAARRVAALEYPVPGRSTRDRYAAVLQRVGEYTGTSTEYEQPSAWSWLPGFRSGPDITWAWQHEPMLALPAGSERAA